MGWGGGNNGTWGSSEWGSGVGGGGGGPPPSISTLGGVDSVTLLAKDLLLVTFDLPMKVEDILLNTNNYTITTSGTQNVIIESITAPETSSTSEVLITLKSVVVGDTYTVSLANLRTAGGTIIDPADSVATFVGKDTKLDNMRSVSTIYDKSASSTVDKIFAAIALEDELIGGS